MTSPFSMTQVSGTSNNPARPFDEPLPAKPGEGTAGSSRFQLQAACEILICLVGFVLLGLAMSPVLFQGSPAELVLQLLFLTVVVIGTFGWAGAILLLLASLNLLFLEPASRLGTASLASTEFVISVIVLLMLGSRYRMQRVASRQSLKRCVRIVMDAIVSVARGGTTNDAVSVLITIIRTAAATVVSIVVCVVASNVLLKTIPIMRSRPGEMQDGLRLIWPGPLAIVVLLAIWILVSELAWRNLTQAQAGLHQRTLALNVCFGDLRMIQRARMRFRKKTQQRARRRGAVSTPPI